MAESKVILAVFQRLKQEEGYRTKFTYSRNQEHFVNIILSKTTIVLNVTFCKVPGYKINIQNLLALLLFF